MFVCLGPILLSFYLHLLKVLGPGEDGTDIPKHFESDLDRCQLPRPSFLISLAPLIN
jgi:hypothetical protein